MKTLIAPLFAVLLSTGLCVLGCKLAGMSGRDLVVAGAVAFGVSLSVAIAAVVLAIPRSRRTRQA